MKKIIALLVSVVVSLSIITPTNAGSLEKKLYKWVIITKTQIARDYNEKYNDKISKIFIKFRYYKDKKTLWKLEVLLKEKITELNNKNILSAKQKKKLNLFNNLYYRTKLLLDYELK